MKLKWEGLNYLCHEVKKEKRKNSVVLIRKGTTSRTKNKYSASISRGFEQILHIRQYNAVYNTVQLILTLKFSRLLNALKNYSWTVDVRNELITS
jgi:hypothetical protein